MAEDSIVRKTTVDITAAPEGETRISTPDKCSAKPYFKKQNRGLTSASVYFLSLLLALSKLIIDITIKCADRKNDKKNE